MAVIFRPSVQFFVKSNKKGERRTSHYKDIAANDEGSAINRHKKNIV